MTTAEPFSPHSAGRLLPLPCSLSVLVDFLSILLFMNSAIIIFRPEKIQDQLQKVFSTIFSVASAACFSSSSVRFISFFNFDEFNVEMQNDFGPPIEILLFHFGVYPVKFTRLQTHHLLIPSSLFPPIPLSLSPSLFLRPGRGFDRFIGQTIMM